jgi:ABC-type phosphate transport system substrate-binding protein
MTVSRRTRSDTVWPMSRTSSVPSIIVAMLVAVLAVAGCGDNVDEGESPSAGAPDQPEATASNAEKSCQAIVGSGAVEDIQAVWDKYKNNNTPFTKADEKRMRNALDELAKAGDNAAPEIREDVVQLVADVGSQIDARINIEGLGKVAPRPKIQREIDALCR